MDRLEAFEAELDKIREKRIIETYSWWGHRYSGFGGTIITSDNILYEYEYYKDLVPPGLEKEKATFIEKKKILNEDEMNKITSFIEKNIINKKFYERSIFDAGFFIFVDYKGVSMEIVNNTGEKEIYDKTKNLIDEILDPTKVKKKEKTFKDWLKDLFNIV